MHVRRLPALLAKYCRWKIFHCVQLLSWHVELLDGEILYTLREAQIVIESWRRHFNTISPHKSLGCKPLAHEVRASSRCVAGCATSPGSAGHAPTGTTANTKLTFRPDHSVGAPQASAADWRHPYHG